MQALHKQTNEHTILIPIIDFWWPLIIIITIIIVLWLGDVNGKYFLCGKQRKEKEGGSEMQSENKLIIIRNLSAWMEALEKLFVLGFIIWLKSFHL